MRAKDLSIKILPTISVWVFIMLPWMMIACTTIHPVSDPDDTGNDIDAFSHDRFDAVLQRFVDDSGRIDYAALKKDSRDLDHYYRLISAYSPDSHPNLFPTDDHRLAYWINAYNAAVIKTVLSHYPIQSVSDVRPPAAFFFMPEKSGFFVFQKPIFGGRRSSLYHLEHGVIRKRFSDPRFHFALNCASLGCPRLPRQAFSADMLDSQLDRETRIFVAEQRNVRINYQNKTIVLSEIFNWYGDDFTDWYRQNHPEQPASLANYIALYLDSEKAKELKAIEKHFTVLFTPYDWRLNDQGGVRADIR